jgi:hypothetical protein
MKAMNLFLVGCLVLLSGCDKQSSSSMNSSLDGQDRGNGTDYITVDQKSAWFADSRRVFNYCIESAPDFGVPTADVATLVNSVIGEWAEYSKRLLSTPDISFKGHFQPSCTSSTDLKIYLGVKNAETAPYSQSGKLLGVAVRTGYDSHLGWGRGFIWLAKHGSLPPDPLNLPNDTVIPNWRAPLTLHAILLHEFGHIFGNGHIPDTIMAANLSDSIIAHDRPEYATKLAGIDGLNKLADLPPYDGQLGLSPSINPLFAQTCLGDISSNFELLTGKPPVGKVRAKIASINIAMHSVTLSLIVADDKGSHSIPVWTSEYMPYTTDPGPTEPVFKVVKDTAEGLSVSLGAQEMSTSYVTITTETGQVLSGTFEHNRSSQFGIADPRDSDITYTFAASGNVLIYASPKGPRFLFVSDVQSVGTSQDDSGADVHNPCP